MEEKAVTNGAAAADVAAPDNKDNTKEEVSKSKEAVANKDAEEQNKGSENGAEGHSGGDVNMAEAEIAEEGGGGDAGAAKQVDSGDVKTDADTKEDANARTEEGEDAKMTEADVGSTEVKDKEEKEDEVENTNEQDESKEQEKGVLAEQEENEGKETDADENQEEEEAEEKGSAGKKDEAEAEGDKKTEENKETPKNKKARSARDRSQGKEEQDGSKSREAKSLLNTPSPYGTNRPQRERKTVERLVEVIDKEPNKNFVVEKGQGTPLKDIPSVAHRISRKKPSDLKFLHSILFGRKGKYISLPKSGDIVFYLGKKVTKGKGESAEAVLPSKDDLRKTITEILKKVDFNTATFSDILKKLDNHYKMDLTPKKEAIKVMIQDELTKLSEEDEEGEGDEDTGKKQQQPQAQEIEA
ncbi:hypothetical protein Zm00014a_024925 [Zea mays]|uniref:DEK-C domain-containing protein n=1 Tax=Zea mays TaxID=4577 RepID=A0A3L6ELE2_MAIZE|nr:hypothetical protein Zm00014a_024925 [Zea mays]PWZ21384.1 hypothetical protein Zm00014a_024925 [Zea mays]